MCFLLLCMFCLWFMKMRACFANCLSLHRSNLAAFTHWQIHLCQNHCGVTKASFCNPECILLYLALVFLKQTCYPFLRPIFLSLYSWICIFLCGNAMLFLSGLLAQKAVKAGLSVKPYIKTSLSPGSGVVTYYLKESGVMDFLSQLGWAAHLCQ